MEPLSKEDRIKILLSKIPKITRESIDLSVFTIAYDINLELGNSDKNALFTYITQKYSTVQAPIIIRYSRLIEQLL